MAGAGLLGALTAAPSSASAAASLGERAAARGIMFGSAVTLAAIDDTSHAGLLLEQCRMLVPEWDMTFHFLRPEPGAFNTGPADRLTAFAAAAGIPIRGQTLIWNDNVPPWVARLSPRERETLLDRHIDQTVGHFAGKLFSWDVVNEPFWPGHGMEGGFRRGPWLDAMGPAYVERAFKRAASADPAVRLVLNEAFCEQDDALGRKVRPLLLGLVDRLLDRGVKLSAIGLQGHLQTQLPFSADRFAAFLTELARRKLDVYLTEIDVNDVALPVSAAARDEGVAERLEAYLRAALASPAVKMMTFWQLADRFSWYRTEYYLKSAPARHRQTPARPLLYDDRLARKPAWHAVERALAHGRR